MSAQKHRRGKRRTDWERVLAALLRGAQSNPRVQPDWDSLFARALSGWLSPRVGESYAHRTLEFLSAARRAVLEARSWRVQRGMSLLNRLEAWRRANRLPPEVDLLCRCHLHASRAYMCYVRGAFSDAIRHLRDGITLNHRLESQLGYPLALAHRIHLTENIIRVHFRSKRYEAGLALAGGLLSYLSQLQKAPYPGRSWSPESLRALPRAFVRAKCAQLTGLVAAVIDEAKPWQRQRLFQVLTRDGHHRLERVCHADAARWFDLITALLHDATADTDKKIVRNLRVGRGDCAKLWFSALFHFLERAQIHPDYEQICRQVGLVVGGWASLPTAVRVLIVPAGKPISHND